MMNTDPDSVDHRISRQAPPVREGVNYDAKMHGFMPVISKLLTNLVRVNGMIEKDIGRVAIDGSFENHSITYELLEQ